MQDLDVAYLSLARVAAVGDLNAQTGFAAPLRSYGNANSELALKGILSHVPAQAQEAGSRPGVSGDLQKRHSLAGPYGGQHI